jgi:succinyl-CoA synthetase beta subunit
MMLLEHHAKELLGRNGFPVPEGIMVRSADDAARSTAFPAMVKAQVPVGGRGNAGGIVVVDTEEALRRALAHVMGMSIKGHPVRACRIERSVDFTNECYLSLSVDADAGGVRVMFAAEGGIDIENPSLRDKILSRLAAADLVSVDVAIDELVVRLPSSLRVAVNDAAHQAARNFFAFEALLLEINPLFVCRDGSWIAGDAKFVIDENALPRQEALRTLIEGNAALYPEAAHKLEQGFDFVVLDPKGDIGLVTTGAGMSMQLIDELVARGHRPFDFCDIRTGGFKGDPGRLIQVFRWIMEGQGIRSVLMNFFAGMTDLGELAKLILVALDQVPEMKRVPITARLIGNGLAEARAVFAAAGNPVAIETDLERAIARATAGLGSLQ